MQRKSKTSLKLNIIMNALLSMSNFIFPLITFPYVSRILLPEGTGKVSFAVSFISYFSMVAQLGIPTYGIRACAQVRDKKEELTRTAHELLMINLVMCCISYFALFIALFTIPRLFEDRLLYLIVSATILLTSIGIEWLYKALELYTYITVRSVIFKFVALVFMFLLIHEKSDYVFYGGISIFASSASNILNLLNAHKYIGFKPVGNYDLKMHLKPVFIFFAMSFAVTVYTHLDTIMLGFMTTDVDVGYYNAAIKIKHILVSIVTSLGAVLLPRASYYIEKGLREDFTRISKKAMHFVFAAAIPLVLYFILYAKEGIYFLSGNNYDGSIVPMQIIMPTVFLIGITNIMGTQMLVPLGHERIVLYSEIAGGVVDVVINALLIPQFKASGAAIGTLVAEAVVLIVQYMTIKKEQFHFDISKYLYRILISSLVAAAIAYLFKCLKLPNHMVLLLSLGSFGIIYLLILLVLKDDLLQEIITTISKKLRKQTQT